MAKLRNSIPAEERARWSAEACAHATAWIEEQSIDSFMVYLAIRSELDLTSLIEWGWRTGRTVIAPRSNETDRSMTLYHLEDWSQLEKGTYGILEPSPSLARETRIMPQVVFTPGLAFDRNGGRLGYGGGYYDRFARANSDISKSDAVKPLWIGTAYEAQLIDAVPTEGHDAVMDGIVTERQLYKI